MVDTGWRQDVYTRVVMFVVSSVLFIRVNLVCERRKCHTVPRITYWRVVHMTMETLSILYHDMFDVEFLNLFPRHASGAYRQVVVCNHQGKKHISPDFLFPDRLNTLSGFLFVPDLLFSFPRCFISQKKWKMFQIINNNILHTFSKFRQDSPRGPEGQIRHRKHAGTTVPTSEGHHLEN
jgi:hypothetical protein